MEMSLGKDLQQRMRTILAVTNDELEQVVWMADNYNQMARLVGCHSDTVKRQCRGQASSMRIKFVEVEDEE